MISNPLIQTTNWSLRAVHIDRKLGMKRTLFVFGLLINLLGLAHLVLGQQPGQKPQPTLDDVVRVKTELVQTDLVVVDRKGRFVEGLNSEQFQLTLVGKPKAIS